MVREEGPLFYQQLQLYQALLPSTNLRSLAASPLCCAVLSPLHPQWPMIGCSQPGLPIPLDIGARLMSAPFSLACLSWGTPSKAQAPRTGFLFRCPLYAALAWPVHPLLCPYSSFGLIFKGQNGPVTYQCGSPPLFTLSCSMNSRCRYTKK